MTRTNNQTKTTLTPVSDCTCKPKTSPRGPTWQLMDDVTASPAIRDVINIHTSINDFLHRWMADNAPEQIKQLLDAADTLWCAELAHFEEGAMPGEHMTNRDIFAATYLAKALLLNIDPDYEEGNDE